jgi:hypothetical protein
MLMGLAIVVAGAIALVGLGFAVGLMVGLVRARHRIRFIEAARECQGGQLIAGLAKMRGEIRAVNGADLLASPMTQAPCVYYKFVVEQERTRNDRTDRSMGTETDWQTVLTDEQAVPAAVRDETGDALVDLKGAEVVLSPGQQLKSGTFNNTPAELEGRLSTRYGFSGKGFIFNKSLRYTEQVIEEGVRVLVVGEVKVPQSGTAVFIKGDHPLLVTDKGEDELVRHYKKEGIVFLIAALVVPLVLLGIAGVVGYLIYTHMEPAAPKKAHLLGPDGMTPIAALKATRR